MVIRNFKKKNERVQSVSKKKLNESSQANLSSAVVLPSSKHKTDKSLGK